MTSDEYATLVGKVVSNLQSLEFALRAYLYAKAAPPHNPFPLGRNFDDYRVGELAPLNAMTCYNSLRELIDRYNGIAPKARHVDTRIVELRDALAHGRVSARTVSSHFSLMKLERPRKGSVKVTFSQELTPDWLKKQVQRTAEEVRKVAISSKIHA